MPDQSGPLAAEAGETAAMLRNIHSLLSHCERELEDHRNRTGGSRELSTALSRIKEGRMWLQEHGHGGWVES